MGVAHISLDLRLGNEGRHRVHNDNVYRPGTNHSLGDLQGLLPVVRLGYVEIVDVHADILGINRVQRMLRINKSRNSAPLLDLSHHVQGNRSLSAGLRTVHFDNSSFGNASQAQSQIQAQAACGSGLNLHIGSPVP